MMVGKRLLEAISDPYGEEDDKKASKMSKTEVLYNYKTKFIIFKYSFHQHICLFIISE